MSAVAQGYPPLRSFSQLLIGGEWVQPSTDEQLEVIAPATGEILVHIPAGAEADIDRAVDAARRAFDDGPWPGFPIPERIAALRRIRAEIASRFDEISDAFAAEIGAPIAVSRAFHDNALLMWDNNIELLESMSFEETRGTGDIALRVVREPVGVVGTIIPWNGPVATASLKVAPALAAGCTVVIKPAPEGPVSMMLMSEAFAAADLPPGVISIVPAGREVGEHLVKHPKVDKIAFTGSTTAGRRVMRLCADRIARTTLELGGKSAGIIADGISLDAFLQTLVFAGIGHTGQVCAALTRILVPRRRQEEIAGAIQDLMAALVVGDPFDEQTVIGPLAMERQRARVEEYVRIGIDEGARLVCGGTRPEGFDRGWFYTPTLFADVAPGMRIAQEEIFGPVLCLLPFDDIEEAIDIANDSIYGLSGAVWADDLALADRIARKVRTGQISINTWGMCVTEPAGGFKQSGIGRERGVEGIHAYLETKLIQGP